MKEFIITLDQMQRLLNILGEYKAKEVIDGIDILRNLKEKCTLEKKGDKNVGT